MKKNGFTLIEVIVTVAILAILCLGIYGLFTTVYKAVAFYRERITVSALADQYLEIARNLPYSQVATLNGSPNGPLADATSPLNVTFNSTNYQIYYVVNAQHDSADNNVGVQDYKQVKLYIKNMSSKATNSFVTTVAPISLASMETGGVLSIKVLGSFYADYNPVSGATINITDTNIVPNINLARTCAADGTWNEIGLPPDSNYHIVVTKNGYSTDQTYSLTQYPNASNPDATVIKSQVTQVTFNIDQLSNLTFGALSQTCQPIPSIGINISGEKLISPGVPKFNKNYTTDSNGSIYPTNTINCSNTCGASNCCLEWDTYTPALTGSQYMVYGTSPVQLVNLLPNASQNFSLILGPATTNSLLAVVKDVSGNSIEGAKVELKDDSLGYDKTGYTGGSVWVQQEWTGGANQDNFTDITKYSSDDGNVNVNTIPLALRLAPGSAPYQSSGSLVSSTFDTGTNQTSYTTLNWQATTENQVTGIGFQIATSNCSNGATDYPTCTVNPGSWNFIGPGGTNSSIDTYNTSGATIRQANNTGRYVRYKVYLSTTDSQKTPALSSVSVNYVSGCPTPGQVMFANLAADDNYTITISANGYQTQTINNNEVKNYFISQVNLSPQ